MRKGELWRNMRSILSLVRRCASAKADRGKWVLQDEKPRPLGESLRAGCGRSADVSPMEQRGSKLMFDVKRQPRFRHSIEQSSWRPRRAFDDIRKIYSEFTGGIGQGEMPPHRLMLGVPRAADLCKRLLQITLHKRLLQ
jgi:hypothetical protein